MRKFRNIVLVLIISFYTISVVGCGVFGKSLTVFDADEIEDILSDMGYMGGESESLDRWETEAAIMFNKDLNYFLFFSKYEEEKDATYTYDRMIETFNEITKDDKFKGKHEKSAGKNYRKFIIEGVFEENYGDFPGAPYQVYLQVENTFFFLLSMEGGKSDIREIENILAKLGY